MQKNITRYLLVAAVVIFGGGGCSGYGNITAEDQLEAVPTPVTAVEPAPRQEPAAEKTPTEPEAETIPAREPAPSPVNVQAEAVVPVAPAPADASVSVTEEKPPMKFSAVNIQNFAFSPSSLTIKKGTTVTWTNNDATPHQIKSGTFNSVLLSKGQSYSFTFDNAGTFDYSCLPHPSMTAKIIVE